MIATAELSPWTKPCNKSKLDAFATHLPMQKAPLRAKKGLSKEKLHASKAEIVPTVLQALSARSNAPECHIGHAHRFKQKQDVEFGTGMFQHKGSLGPQGISTKPSLPSYSLGASTRDQMYKVRLHLGAAGCRGSWGGV